MSSVALLDDLNRLLREADALLQADTGAQMSLQTIARAGAELNGALSQMVPAVRELELRMDIGLSTGNSDAGFDALEMDRYAFIHETCRELSEQASGLQGLQSQIEGSRLALASTLKHRATRTRALREAVRRIGPADASGMLESVCAHAEAFADTHGVSLVLTGEPTTFDLQPEALVTAGMLLEALARYAVLVARDAADGPGARLALAIEFHELPGELVVNARAGGEFDARRLDPQAAQDAADTARAAQQLERRLRREGARAVHDGTTLTLRVPNAGVERALLFVGVGEHPLALPIDQVAGVVRLIDVEHDLGQGWLECNGTRVPTLDLAPRVRGAATGDDPGARRYAALIGSPTPSHALLFDRIEGHARTRVTPLAQPLPRLCPAIGAADLDDGRTVMVLDAPAVIAGDAGGEAPGGVTSVLPPRILVVDDSVTIRKVTERMLRRHRLRVQLARDGREALEVIPQARPDLVLLDIEMPRMNGFQFLEALRADPALADIPVIMISSRTGEKHRQQAAALGVHTFLGKPFKERELLAAMMERIQWRP